MHAQRIDLLEFEDWLGGVGGFDDLAFVLELIGYHAIERAAQCTSEQ